MYTEYMYKDSLTHHGILGQKWGVRRYQNPDGTLTPEGRRRYGIKSTDSPTTKRVKGDLARLTNDQFSKKYHVSKSTYMKRVDKYGDPYKNGPLPKIGKAINKHNEKQRNKQKNKEIKKYGAELTKAQRQRVEDDTARQYLGTAMVLAGRSYAATHGNTPLSTIVRGAGAGMIIGNGMDKKKLKEKVRAKNNYYKMP